MYLSAYEFYQLWVLENGRLGRLNFVKPFCWPVLFCGKEIIIIPWLHTCTGTYMHILHLQYQKQSFVLCLSLRTARCSFLINDFTTTTLLFWFACMSQLELAREVVSRSTLVCREITVLTLLARFMKQQFCNDRICADLFTLI